MGDRFYFEMNRRQSQSIIDSFERLESKAARTRILRTANTKAARPWRMAAKRKLAASAKALSKTIDLVTRTYKSTGNVVTIVGSNKKHAVWKNKNYPTNVLQLIEFGTQRHVIVAGANEDLDADKTYRGGRKLVPQKGERPTVLSNINTMVGKGVAAIFGPDVFHPGARAKPFMRPTFQENLSLAIAIHERETAAGIAKEFAKGLKK